MTNTNNTNNFSAAELIVKREAAIADIKKYWAFIHSDNVMEKGAKPDFNIKEIYKKVSETELNLIKIKIAIQAINMGLSSMEEMKGDNLYFQIYLLQQLKERKVKLEKLKTNHTSTQIAVLPATFTKLEIERVAKDIKAVEEEIKKHNLTKKFKL